MMKGISANLQMGAVRMHFHSGGVLVLVLFILLVIVLLLLA